ncbi:MAG: GAF domain-containing sensor histidine kinase [Anaerolineales bacterium]|nr:GAF domain-containing sensor histidine kinase [Anaerolineales bacterium]
MTTDHHKKHHSEPVQMRQLLILNEIVQALNSSINMDQSLQTTLAKVAELLGLETGWVWLLHAENDQPYLAAAQNLPPALAYDPAKMTGGCYCLRTYLEGDLAGAANVNVVECSRLQGLIDGTDGLRYHASIPLYAHGKKLGVLNVASTDWRGLAPEDLRLLYTIGDTLSIAIERGRLFDQSVRLGAVEERIRLAREIHDTLAQRLTAVSLQLESADVLLELGANLDKAHTAVQKALRLTRMNLEEIRRSVLDLRAATLAGRTLPQALADLAAALPDGMAVQFEIIDGERPLSPRIEAGVYRIAQEMLNNVAQHAQAEQVQMQLTLSPQNLTLLVADDGIGFDAEKLPPDRFGLVGMNERVRLLNGRLNLSTSPGNGTQIVANIPLN